MKQNTALTSLVKQHGNKRIVMLNRNPSPLCRYGYRAQKFEICRTYGITVAQAVEKMQAANLPDATGFIQFLRKRGIITLA